MNSSGLGLCCAQGNAEWMPDRGTGANPKGKPTTAAWGSGNSCSHQGGPQAHPHWWFHQHPRSFCCILQDRSWPSFGNSPFREETIIPGRSQMPRHQLTAPPGRTGFPQTTASPKASKCPTEKSAMAPTCSQTPENRLDGSCIPNRGGWGGGGGSLKAGRDLQVPLN